MARHCNERVGVSASQKKIASPFNSERVTSHSAFKFPTCNEGIEPGGTTIGEEHQPTHKVASGSSTFTPTEIRV